KDTSKTDEDTSLVEVRVIHGHVFRVRGGLVDERVTAVTEVSASPCPVGLKELCAVVLRAPDAELGIGRMDRHALELRSAKGCVITIDPGQSRIVRFPDAAIVTGVNHRRIGGC